MNDPEKKARFFCHTECEYFPCHATDRPEDFNCLFCYCPLYALGEHCGGSYFYTDKGIKNCSLCLLAHERGSYLTITGKIAKIIEMTRKKDDACE